MGIFSNAEEMKRGSNQAVRLQYEMRTEYKKPTFE